MHSNRSLYIDNTHELVKRGYEEFSSELIKGALLALKRDELNDSQRDYLIYCLRKTLDTGDANKGFGLRNERGKKKKPTSLRDVHAAALVIYFHGKGINHEETLKKTAEYINKVFPEALIDIKTVDKAYTEHKSKILNEFDFYKPLLIRMPPDFF